MSGERVRLGMVRLTDAAPLVHAFVAGLFAAEGVAVELAVEPSWANIADKLAWGLLDGAVMLPPLAIAMTLGLRDPPTRLVIPAGISRGHSVTCPLHNWVIGLENGEAQAPDEGCVRRIPARVRDGRVSLELPG